MTYSDKVLTFLRDAEAFFARWDRRIQRGTTFVKEGRKFLEAAKKLIESEEFIALARGFRDRIRAIKDRIASALRRAGEVIDDFSQTVLEPSLSTNSVAVVSTMSCGAILGMSMIR